MTPAILLAGAFGQANPGDDALLAAFATALPGHRLVVPARGPIPATIGDGAVFEVIPARATAVAAAVRRVDAVVLAGGTVFKVLDPTSRRPALALLAQANALASAARLAGRPVAALGVGVGRLDRPNARRLARRLVGRLDLLVLRDEGSADVLAAAGVPSPIRVGADPAWSLFSKSPNPIDMAAAQPSFTATSPAPAGRVTADDAPGRPPSNRTAGAVLIPPTPVGPTANAGAASVPGPIAASGPAGPVHVAISHLAGIDPGALAGALEVAVARGHRVVLEPWQRDRARLDDQLATAVAARLPVRAATVLVDGPGDLLAAAERYRRAAAVVGLRFHALVAAGAAGTRFLAVDHEPKLAGIAQRLGQRHVPAHAPVGVLRRSLGLALDGRPPAPDAVAIEVARANAGFELLRLLLGGGHDVDLDTLDGLDLVGGGRSW